MSDDVPGKGGFSGTSEFSRLLHPQELAVNAGSMLFDHMTRTDATPGRFNETRFQFLNRSASPYFGVVRDLIEEWLSLVPAEHRPDLLGRLQKDNASHCSAFWELYLHEGYRRSGCDIEIHPVVDDSPNRPDFRIHSADGGFYLEAVRVGDNGAKIAADRRLDAVYQVLSDLKIQDFSLSVSTNRMGAAPLATRALRAELIQWVTGLDAGGVSAAIADGRTIDMWALPQLPWRGDGWDLTFTALPVDIARRGVDRSALGAMGFATAGILDNVSGFRKVLEKKHGRYGRLNLPFVIAVESDKEIPTRAYDIDRVLYGLSARRPCDATREPSDLAEEGFWFGRNAWRRGDTPQIITSPGIAPWSIATQPADVWTTLEPAVEVPGQPPWLRRVVVGAESVPAGGADLAAHFGLDLDWVASSPNFDLR